MRFRNLCLLVIITSSLSWNRVSGEVWEVPEDQKGKVAPVKFTPEMQKQGEVLYMKNCQSCHGIPGKNNWAKLTPPPGDLSSDKLQQQKDGEIYYRITTGKVPMPEFRNILSEEERWMVITFLRSFNPGYIQPEPKAQVGFAGKKVRMLMDYRKVDKKIVIQVTELNKENTEFPFQGAEVILFVKRYFGYMQVGESKTTGENGIAFIDFPTDLPGDTAGNIELIARVNDSEGKLSGAQVIRTLQIGVPTDKPSLIETRAWWSTREKAPIWVILTYTFSVLLVWGFILYILFNLLKIRKNNK